ncbi:MAG: 50S ribosomal protein L35 [Spirochaetales bacterium]
MPKMKTNKAAKMRFKLRPSGSVKRGQQNTTHILTKMSRKRKNQLKKNVSVAKNQEKMIKQLIQG